MADLIATRQAFGEELLTIMQENEKVMALTADLGESLRMLKIRETMPDRFFDTGVAEANMVGVAAGLALGGFIPVAGTFAVFMTRAFDHIRVQACQNNLHVVLVGSHGGVSNALDGGSAHALEDIAYMRALPNMTIIFPIDGPQTRQALRAAISAEGPVYVRLYREPTAVITQESDDFILGKASVMLSGKDISLIASGPQVATALTAAKKLAEQKIECEVVSVPTIKPLDVKTIASSAKKTKKVITIEDHNINGGLGSAVAEALSEYQPTSLKRLAVTQFGESGTYQALMKKLGLDEAGAVAAIKKTLSI